jgi:hypothetical protein
MNLQTAINIHRMNWGFPELYSKEDALKVTQELNDIDDEWTYEPAPYSSTEFVIQVLDEDKELIGVI